MRHAEMRERLLSFSLTTFCEKALAKCLSVHHELSTKKVTLSVNYAEEQALVCMFQRVETDPYNSATQQKILLTLRTVYGATEIKHP